MQIAGGLYTETCVIPSWHEELGSGGRAATAISKLSTGSVLHTYAGSENQNGVKKLEALGLKVQQSRCQNGVAFAYFHPLSKPFIEPPSDQIFQNDPIKFEGKAVLRFGFIEGDAIVDAGRAVYDPQTSQAPAPFSENGSKAEKLAIVVNEAEATSIAKVFSATQACGEIISKNLADVVVLKRGTRGASVFERDCSVHFIPAYWSKSVFKIGTGDVFSAIFAFYWAEERRPAAEAADLASRYVARYAESKCLAPTNPSCTEMLPVGQSQSHLLRLEGRIDTIGRRYTLEEAYFRLKELGTKVVCPLVDGPSNADDKQGSLLFLSDQPGESEVQKCINAAREGRVVTMLMEIVDQSSMMNLKDKDVNIVSDFTTALYHASWSTLSD